MSISFDGNIFRRNVLAVIDGEREYPPIARLVDEQLAAGVRAQQLTDELTVLMLDLRAQDREDDEDMVMNVLDYFTGW